MAENQDGQEKTEEPSSRRLEESRKQGQVPRSREFNTFFMMFASSVAFILMGSDMVIGLMDLLASGLTPDRARIFDPNYMLILLWDKIFEALMLIAPFLLVTVVVAILSSLLIGGWNFSTEAYMPKFSKLDPLKGMKKIIGTQGLVELVKAILKVAVVGAIATAILYWKKDLLLLLGYQALHPALANAGNQALWFFVALAVSLIIVAVIDVPFQIWSNKQQLRMTKYEVKQEHKQQEGSPETRQRVRQMQRELAQRRMMANVPKADVIITNPTHYAVAIKYDKTKAGAPVVVAKGSDLVAMRIRTIALEHSVPIMSSPALARAIFYNTEIDQEIPAGLYMAVAKVLAYIFELKRRPGTDFSTPLSMHDVPIPDDLRRD
jgi:flagellar biosynthetic protein FlhB